VQSFTLAYATLNTVPPSSLSTTGTRLDQMVDLLDTDRGLRAEIPRGEILEGLAAANSLNQMIANGIRTLNLAADGQITYADVVALNAWFNATPTRIANFTALHGDDEQDADSETGFHLIQNDGASTPMFGRNLANTIADGLYHIGFAIVDDRLANEDGDANASVVEVAAWLDYFFGTVSKTGTNLDDIVEVIWTDRGLTRWTPAEDIREGAEAANALNQLILDGLAATGALADDRISADDIRAVNAWIKADTARYDLFVDLHGDDENGEEWGFHAVQNDGAESQFMGRNLVNTIADGIYHIGFDIVADRFVNEDGDANADIGDVATWLNYILLNRTLIEGSDLGTWRRGTDVAESFRMMGGDDDVEALGGDDLVDLGAGNDWVSAGLGNDTVVAGEGHDWVVGDEGADSMLGGLGDDGLEGWDGADTLDGGAGNDQAYGALGRDLLRGGEGDDKLNGQMDANTLEGGNGNDTLSGGYDNDRLDAGAGNDLVVGGDGNDSMLGGDGRDTLRGGRGQDTLAGALGDDDLGGEAGSDSIGGAEGNDTLYGGYANDTLHGGTGDDKALGDVGTDRLMGAEGHDSLWGQDGADTLQGGEGNDWAWGEVGADSLLGEAGADSMDGGLGNDSLGGGEGDDLAWGGDGNDLLQGGAGLDRLNGGNGNDSLAGGTGNDQIDGNAGDDLVWGGLGADSVRGGAGNDLILSRSDAGEPLPAGGGARIGPAVAEAADDVLRGDSGADLFRFDVTTGATAAVAGNYLKPDGTVDWAALTAAESLATHGWWLNGIGADTVADFSAMSGDAIRIRGEGVAVTLSQSDRNGDGVTDTLLTLTAGAGGDALGTVTVLSARLTLAQVTVEAVQVAAYARPANAGYDSADAAYVLPAWPEVI
jgi:Ca2+-binding RTX toxin-like protein